MPSEVDVLVVGAGPVGLAVAAELARRGVACRVLDRRPGPRPGTRGCTVWQRTLELFGLMGMPVAGYLGCGVPFRQRVYHIMGTEPLTVDMREPECAYPLPLIVGQQTTEQFLTDHLLRQGVAVERGAMVTSAAQAGDGATVQVDRAASATERIDARWVVLAQGSRSELRASLGIGWTPAPLPGTHLLQVDARVDGNLHADPADCHLFLQPHGSLGSLPLPDGRRRLFAGVPGEMPDGPEPGPQRLVSVVRGLSGVPGVRLRDARFAWQVNLYTALADTFRRGPFLLAGDTAHTTVPVTAQGMNLGLADAVNLGWKLAAVVRDGAPGGLLDTYAEERRAVAIAVLARTRRSYWGGVGAVPPVEQVIAAIRAQREARTGLAENYADGPITEDLLGGDTPAAGHRAPDVALPGPGHRLYDLLRHGGWTLLAFPDGRDAGNALAIARARGVPAYVIGSTSDQLPDPDGEVRAAYLGGGAGLCLVRPDGYLGFRGPVGDPAAFGRYLTRVLG